MAKAILSAPDSATRREDLITELWEFHSAYRCIEAQERQYVNIGKEGSLPPEWSVVMAALEFANTVLETKLEAMGDSNVSSDSDVLVLWGAYGVYECIHTKVEEDLMGPANSVSGALALLNKKFKQCIGDFDEVVPS
jgi:hypothetical protein